MKKIKMTIAQKDETEVSVDVITSFFNKTNTEQYIMYSKGEIQNGNTIVYTSKISKENNSLILTEITDDGEWLEVKNIIKSLLV